MAHPYNDTIRRVMYYLSGKVYGNKGKNLCDFNGWLTVVE
jgi:hypothetical protein